MISREFLLLTFLVLASSPRGSNCDVLGRMFRGASSMARSSYQAGSSFVTSYTSQRQETTTTTPSSQPGDGDSSSKSSDADKINSDFESQCLVSRGASLRSPPQVFFFSNPEHGEKSYGCNPNANITLGLDGEGANFGDDPNDWKLDVGSIQERLLDTGSYDASLPTYLLVHGFMASWNGDIWMCQLKDKILNETRANVFIVDWSGGSMPMLPIDYGAAVGNTKYVGQLLAKFIVTLLGMTRQSDASKFHMIGHSLGSHISGFVGYALGSQFSLGRITGLDPAGPCWTSSFGQNATQLSSTGELSAGRRRLSAQSAQLVVALHTDAGRFGLNENCGHYDIYVNGGNSPQPVCKSVVDRVDHLLSLRLMDAIDLGDIACAHGYAHSITDAYLASLLKLFAKRLTRDVSKVDKFAPANEQCFLIAYRCASWAAFKKGECGLSSSDKDDQDLSYAVDALAIDPRVDALRLARAAQEAPVWMPPDEHVNDLHSDLDDEHINEEEFKMNLMQSSFMPSALVSDSPNKQWQHFIKTGSSKLSLCAYTYQLVIAVEPTDQTTNQCKLYVEIPLDREPGVLDVRTNEKATSRIVQVSHKVAQGSWARQQFSKLGANLTDDSGQLDFYTALITFDAASSDECYDLASSEKPKKQRDRWYLCGSLSHIKGARLLAPDNGIECMKRVRWVVLAHLSGSNADIRHDGSYLFEPDARAEIEQERDATRVHQHRRGGLVRKLVGGVQGGIECLTSAVDPTQRQTDCDGSPFGGVNLKFAAPLEVVGDENRRQVLRI